MPELTLESLAMRVEALEKLVAERPTVSPGKVKVSIRPGKGDWEAALRAARELSQSGTYDWDMLRDQYECDMKDAARYFE
jgi:hypothetical protein